MGWIPEDQGRGTYNTTFDCSQSSQGDVFFLMQVTSFLHSKYSHAIIPPHSQQKQSQFSVL